MEWSRMHNDSKRSHRVTSRMVWGWGLSALLGLSLVACGQKEDAAKGAAGGATPGAPAASGAAPGAPASAADAGAGAGGGRFGRPGGRPQPVSVATVQRRDLAVTVEAIGSITSANTAVVRAKVSGELKAIYFKEGQAVRAGQLLALVDPRPYEIARDQAQATLARDQAQLENARADLTRYKDLVTKEAAPRQQLDTQQALVRQLEATVLSDQAALDNAKLQLSYTRVVAPISGQVGLKQADLGNNITPSDANGILSVAQMQPAAVVFAVPDARLTRIREQLQAKQALPVQAWDRERKQMLAEGRVDSTDNAIDASTSTIKVKALFPNKDASLFPNQFVNVRLQLDTLKNAIVVPTAALQRGAPGTYVYVVSDGQVALRKVALVSTDGDWSAVRGELQPGEQVVTDGADRLRDGGKAEVIKAPAGGASGAGRGEGRRGAAGAASAPASAGVSGNSDGNRPRWMDRVPPEMVEKLKAMSEEERRAWLQQRRGGQ
ncbi:MAG: multidrug transporter subunit MdtA [Roseateles depolymerans]|uniref:Multidrug transporter subunit MdtA n=1 Tax=Roseateles depolymerans TaxID=76731 RepID=A0A2W5DJT6_9BURK|nr:MAG: multidrug transporter subunit MdtA [Roseateles depolymerans]